MQIQNVEINKSVTKTYTANVTVRGKKYNLVFQTVDGKVEEWNKVRTAVLSYFNFSEATRKKHFNQILKHLNIKNTNGKK